MATPVRSLLSAVRRRLWLDRFLAAARRALWASAALLLLAAVLQAAVGGVPALGVAAALVVPWAGLLARAAGQRPGDAACALWADRHLGGASAYGTLLECAAAPAASQAAARHSLEHWAAAQAPRSAAALAAQRAPLQLARPLLTALVCAALAAFVLSLPEPGATALPAPVAAASNPPQGRGDGPAAVAEAPATADLATQVASALHDAEDASAAPADGRTGAAAPASARRGEGTPTATAATGAAAMDAAAPPGTPTADGRDAPPGAATARGAGAAAGREAGAGRDERADVGISSALRGSMAVQRSVLSPPSRGSARQADLDSPGRFEDAPAGTDGSAPVALAAAAATPPPAHEDIRLSPTQTPYVQAWLKTSATRR